jgi:hypothetical protein
MHCATSRKAAGSIPDEFIAISYWLNHAGRNMAPVSTLPLTNEYQRYFLFGKAVRGGKLTLLPGYADYLELRCDLNVREPSGNAQVCLGISFTTWRSYHTWWTRGMWQYWWYTYTYICTKLKICVFFYGQQNIAVFSSWQRAVRLCHRSKEPVNSIFCPEDRSSKLIWALVLSVELHGVTQQMWLLLVTFLLHTI